MTSIDDPEWVCLALEVDVDRAELLLPERIERIAARIRDVLELEVDVMHGHRFEPIGFSYLAFGNLGRLAMHTWPEHRFATIDLWLGAARLHERSTALAAMLSGEGYRITADWLSHTNPPLPARLGHVA